jgi:hypothetical protein
MIIHEAASRATNAMNAAQQHSIMSVIISLNDVFSNKEQVERMDAPGGQGWTLVGVIDPLEVAP